MSTTQEVATPEVAPVADAPATVPDTPAPVADPTPAVEPVTPQKEETPPSAPDAPKEESIFTEEELKQILDEALAQTTTDIPNRPTKFLSDDKKPEPETPIITPEEVEELNRKVQEATQSSENIEKWWSLVATAVPELPTILEGLIEWKEDAVPLHWKPENWERVTSNKLVYSFVEPLLQWKPVDIPKIIADIAAMRKASTPQVSSKSEASAPTPVKRNFLAEAVH